MAQPEFETPEYLKNQSAEEIHERMMNELPEDIDDMPGGFAYDFTMPAALEKDELINFHLVRTLQLAFPQFAWDEWLDLHGAQVHIDRRQATFAEGYVQVTVVEVTSIPAGTVFMTPQSETQDSIEYVSTEDVDIEETGDALIPIRASEEGSASNVSAGSITMVGTPSDVISAVTNPEPVTGGTNRESDDDYYDRIAAEYQASMTFTGNDADYIRWAKAAGAGDCSVIDAPNGPGTVGLIIVDTEGLPASQELIDAVYNYIVSPSDRSARLLPTACAQLTVGTTEMVAVNYTITGLVYDASTTLEQIKSDFRAVVLNVYGEAFRTGVLKYNDIRPLISYISGVSDFSSFLINGSTDNITLGSGNYPQTGALDFSV